MGHCASVKVSGQLWESFLALHLCMGSGDELKLLGLCCERLHLLYHLLDSVFTTEVRFYVELTGQCFFFGVPNKEQCQGFNL